MNAINRETKRKMANRNPAGNLTQATGVKSGLYPGFSLQGFSNPLATATSSSSPTAPHCRGILNLSHMIRPSSQARAQFPCRSKITFQMGVSTYGLSIPARQPTCAIPTYNKKHVSKQRHHHACHRVVPGPLTQASKASGFSAPLAHHTDQLD